MRCAYRGKARAMLGVGLFLLAVAATAFSPVLAQTKVYGSRISNSLSDPIYEIDLATGGLTQVGNCSFPTATIALSPIDGPLYYTEWDVTNGRVATWNPGTGTHTTIGNLGSGVPRMARSAFRSDGVLYSMDDACGLYTVNTTTGVATTVGNVSGAGCVAGDIAFAADDTLYVLAEKPTSRIFVVNMGTLVATPVHTISSDTDIAGAFFATAGELFTVRNSLVSFESGTFNETSVGNFPSGVRLSDAATASVYADLSVSKIIDDGTPVVGETVTFTVTVSNSGPAAAGGVAATDLLPSGYTYVSDDGAGSYDDGTGVWTVGPVAASSAEQLNIVATVKSSGSYDNTAEITASDQFDSDSTVNNGQAAEDDQFTVGATPQVLSTVKRAFQLDETPVPSGSTLPQGTPVKFLIYVNNPGGPVADVSLQDILDSTFGWESGSLKFDSSLPSCAALSCTLAEEDSIFAAVDAGTGGTETVDGDVVSYIAGSTTLDVGDRVQSNARLDLPGNRVWAVLFTVRLQ